MAKGQNPRTITIDDITWEQAKIQAKESGFGSVSAMIRFLIVNKCIEKLT